jgi:hypothetical protein
LRARTAIALDALVTLVPSSVAVATIRTLLPASRLRSFNVSPIAPLIGEQLAVVQSCH